MGKTGTRRISNNPLQPPPSSLILKLEVQIEKQEEDEIHPRRALCSQMQAAGHKNGDGERRATRRRKWGNMSRAEAATSFITSEADCQGVALSGHTLDLHT